MPFIKKIPLQPCLLAALLLAGAMAVSACSYDSVVERVLPAAATATSAHTPTPVTPSPTFTLTPTITPTPSPTPVPAVRIDSGDRAFFYGDWETALKEYQLAYDAMQAGLSSDPEVVTAALLGLGRTYQQVGNYAAALDALRQLISDYPDSLHRAPAFYHLGRTYSLLGRHLDAAEAYQRYLALRSGLIDAYVFDLRGDALSASGDYPGALVDYQAALKGERAGGSIQTQIKLARTYAITGDYSTALVMYTDIYNRTESDETKAYVDLLIANAHFALGQSDAAYAAYQDAVENFPVSYNAYLALVELVNAGVPVDELDRGLIDYFAGEYAVALAALDRYLNASPLDPATARYYKGQTLSAMGDYSGAVEQWDIVIDNWPQSRLWDDAWEQKGFTQWYYLDQPGAAVETLAGFVQAAPASTRAGEFLYDAARVAERSGELINAAVLWERSANEYPASDWAYPSLLLSGLTHYRLDNFSAAQTTFERMLVSSANITQRATAYFWIGKCQEAEGDQAAARASWAQSASVDATGYYSERARDLLVGRDPFTPPKVYDLAFDLKAEKAEADAWLRQTFGVLPEVDLKGLGPLANDSRLQRGTELWELGEYDLARIEFEALRQAVVEDAVSTYRLAGYYTEIGLHRSGILAARQVLTLAGMDDAETMMAPVYFNHIRFGVYFSDLILPAAQKYNIHPLLLFSVVRQESLFEPFASSSASARGLMQIMPATGQGIYEQMQWPPEYTTSDLNRPLVSVTFGADYLSDQRSYLGGDLFAALAAYNGGPGNALVWQKMAPDDPDLFVEMVRFEETRRYIRSIYEIFTIYRRLYDRTP